MRGDARLRFPEGNGGNYSSRFSLLSFRNTTAHLPNCQQDSEYHLPMKLATIALIATALARANAAETTVLMHRGLRVVETSDNEGADANVADLRDDELGASQDFWGSWENHYTVHSDHNEPCNNDAGSSSGNGEYDPTAVGDIPVAAKKIFQRAESVITAALPFDVDHAKSLLLPIGLVVAALLVVAVAAVLVGVQRQQSSQPMFGPVELASDLPDPMTTSAASEVGGESDLDSPSHADDDGCGEADTGATILGEEEEEKEEDREVVALA